MRIWIFLSLTLMLIGCSKPPKSDTTIASISGYNFMSEGVQEFYVDGAWGSNIGVGGGGGQVCCASIPKQWHTGLSAKVVWVRSDCGPGKCKKDKNGKWPEKNIEKTVPIEPYSEPGDIQVMFLPGDEIKVYVFDAGPWHPDHPSKLGRPRPLEKEK